MVETLATDHTNEVNVREVSLVLSSGNLLGKRDSNPKFKRAVDTDENLDLPAPGGSEAYKAESFPGVPWTRVRSAYRPVEVPVQILSSGPSIPSIPLVWVI